MNVKKYTGMDVLREAKRDYFRVARNIIHNKNKNIKLNKVEKMVVEVLARKISLESVNGKLGRLS